MKPKKKRWDKNISKQGTPKKGYRWAETTSGRIPEPQVERIPKAKDKPKRLKPMRTVASGTYGSGAPRKTERNRSKPRSL